MELEKHFNPDDIVLIHDAIRPMVSPEIISDNIRVAKERGNAVTVIPCAEAMIQTEDGIISVGSYPRDRLKRTQTPQSFHLGHICDLHRRALQAGITNSVESCTLMIEMGEQVYFSAGSEKNIKLTTSDDMDIFEALVKHKNDVIVYCVINSVSSLMGALSMWMYLPGMLAKVNFRELRFGHHFHETLIYFILTIAASV